MNAAKAYTDQAVHIRWATGSDLTEIGLVMRYAGLKVGTVSLAQLLRDRRVIGNVAEMDGRIVGAVIYSLDPDRLHVHKLAVDPRYQGCGIGRKILNRLKGKLGPRRPRLTLNCRESNLAAQQFYRANRLKAVEIRWGYYTDTGEDAYAFEYRWEG